VDALEDRLHGHHRWHAVRAHPLELAGNEAAAASEYQVAAERAHNVRERSYPTACGRSAAGRAV
jgi:predicted RNA polymerase sigma factor